MDKKKLEEYVESGGPRLHSPVFALQFPEPLERVKATLRIFGVLHTDYFRVRKEEAFHPIYRLGTILPGQ